MPLPKPIAYAVSIVTIGAICGFLYSAFEHAVAPLPCDGDCSKTDAEMMFGPTSHVPYPGDERPGQRRTLTRPASFQTPSSYTAMRFGVRLPPCSHSPPDTTTQHSLTCEKTPCRSTICLRQEEMIPAYLLRCRLGSVPPLAQP